MARELSHAIANIDSMEGFQLILFKPIGKGVEQKKLVRLAKWLLFPTNPI